MFVVVSRSADANLTRHERRNFLSLYCEPFFSSYSSCLFFFFLATDEACLPSAVRTDFGKCAIVRFRFAADAAFLMFFFAALLCFVDAIVPHSNDFHSTSNLLSF